METLNERLTNAFNILIDRDVFLKKYNSGACSNFPDGKVELQLVTSYLSKNDMKIILSVCDLFSLDFGINSIPSLTGNCLSVIFTGSNG